MVDMVVGDLTLDTLRLNLRGPGGDVLLGAQVHRVAERLFRRPGQLHSSPDLIRAMYPDGEEPAGPHDVLRKRIQLLRSSIMVLTRAGVCIKTERGIGWAVEAGPLARPTREIRGT